MSGQQLTALQRAEQRDVFGPGRPVSDLVWLADWRSMGLPYCSIYIVAPIDGWPCKVGISTNPMKRISTLQTSCWKQLEVKWCGWAPTMQQAKEVEMKSHASLTNLGLWLHGEWFDMRPEKAADLVAFEAELAGVSCSTELPPGVATDFVQKLYTSRYGTPAGIASKAERDHEKNARSVWAVND